MGNNDVFQFGEKSIYIERNEGNVYVGDYVCKRLRVYTIVDFSFIRTFAPSF